MAGDDSWDYTEIMQSYLEAGGEVGSELFKALWKHFIEKLDKIHSSGQSFRDKYYYGKTNEEIWRDYFLGHGVGSGATKYNTPMPSFATGGYTGEWGPEGKLAMLHEKELILNKH
jgi:hypothetical protein